MTGLASLGIDQAVLAVCRRCGGGCETCWREVPLASPGSLAVQAELKGPDGLLPWAREGRHILS